VSRHGLGASEPDIGSVEPGALLDVLACAPENASTVWSTVVERSGLGPGEVLLAHGGGGGIGSMAIAVAQRVGAVAVTTCSDRHQLHCLALGASAAMDYEDSDFGEVLHDPQVRAWLEEQRVAAVRRAEFIHGNSLPTAVAADRLDAPIQLDTFRGASMHAVPAMLER